MGVEIKQCSIMSPSDAILSKFGVKPSMGFPMQPSESQLKSSAVMSIIFGLSDLFEKPVKPKSNKLRMSSLCNNINEPFVVKRVCLKT